MKKAKRKTGRWSLWRKGAVAALVVLGGTVAAVWIASNLYTETIAKAQLERLGTKLLGTRVSVRSVRVSPLTGHATVRGLRVGNAPGFVSETAVEIDRIEARLVLRSLWNPPYRFDFIRVHSPDVTVEGTPTRHNLGVLQARLEAELEAMGCTKDEPRIAIGLLRIDDIHGTVRWVGVSGQMAISPEDIEFKNVGARGKGIPLNAVIRKVVDQTVNNTMKGMGKGLLESVTDRFRFKF